MEITTSTATIAVCKIKGQPFFLSMAYYWQGNLSQRLFCSVFYIQKSLDSDGEVFLGPNKLSEDGTTAQDGSLLAYGFSERGSDWITLKVLESDWSFTVIYAE